ncbi:MAG: hypothetical protein PG977_001124 [Bartonella clarridgeiae]|nr:MAG: hypothetical protein PG977_001124 [Bartonella clarridgeiae]
MPKSNKKKCFRNFSNPKKVRISKKGYSKNQEPTPVATE